MKYIIPIKSGGQGQWARVMEEGKGISGAPLKVGVQGQGSGVRKSRVQGQGSGVNLKLGTRNLKLYCACGAIIPPSKNPNQNVPKEHCSRKCKDAANTEARKTGKRVMTAVPVRSERKVLISTMEKLKASGQAIVVESARKTTMPPQVLNLGAMTHQERLGRTLQGSRKTRRHVG